jgi:transcriptional regulator with XRE-family HTH domain
MEETDITNALVKYRKRMNFSQKQVAALLGFRNTAILSHYEKGTALPSLKRAMALEAIYRVPIAFLFPNLNQQIRSEIREKEDRIFKSKQNHKH